MHREFPRKETMLNQNGIMNYCFLHEENYIDGFLLNGQTESRIILTCRCWTGRCCRSVRL